ncbi:unnamed protein product [Sympodiomycopsis kandeliae]
MLSTEPDGKVADVAERALLNASVTCGMSADGRSFTYENQLAMSTGNLCDRHEWFQCACCPPNVLRTLGIGGGFFWSPAPPADAGIAIHHYFDGTIEHKGCEVTMKTAYPWNGRVEISVEGKGGPVWLRVPGWAGERYTFSSGARAEGNGYARVSSDHTMLDLPMKPRLAFSHPHTGQDAVTLFYGPLVYCLGSTDHEWERNHFKDLCLRPNILSSIEVAESNGVAFLKAAQAGFHRKIPSSAAMNEVEGSIGFEEAQGKDLTFVPYYYRANRQTKDVQVRTSFRLANGAA